MKKDFKSKIGVVILFLIVGAFWWKLFGEGYKEKAKGVEIKSLAASIMTAEEMYHQEYGEYSKNPETLGVGVESDASVALYLDKEQIPEPLRNQMRQEDLPYAAKDDYQFIILQKESDKETYWIQRKGQELMPIK